MKVEWHIAWRYLFSKKGYDAINIVSGVSTAAVAVVTAAMICVLSVMNGFESLVQQMFSEFDPQLRITSSTGKYFDTDAPCIDSVRTLPFVEVVSEQVIETALVQYNDHQTPAILMGVDDAFQNLTHIDSIIAEGNYSVYDGSFERAVMGRGLAAQLGVNPYLAGGLQLFAPKREGRVNMLRPDECFNHSVAFVAGTFAVNQIQYDDRVTLVSISQARALFDYNDHQATAIGLRISPTVSTKHAKQQIRKIVGDEYIVADQYEQQADFYRIVHVEKFLTLLLMVLILLIAGFNIISSLSMLILDKQDNIQTISHLGADIAQIRRIFLYEGWIISSLGALGGLIIGVVLCLIQEHLGIIKLGDGTQYVIAAYPVVVHMADVVLVAVIVLTLGYLAALYPSRKITIDYAK